MAAPVLRPLSTGEVLDVSFGLYRALFVPLLTVALASRAIPAILGIYLQAAGGFSAHWVMGTVQLFVGIFLSAIGVAATTYIVSGAYLGTDVTAGDAIRKALGLVGRLLVLTMMTTLIIGLGMVLLLVPGLILISGLALSTAVLVLETPISPNDAMNRSWQLTKGSRWKVLLTFLVAVLLLVVPMMAVGMLGVFGSMVGLWSDLMPLVLISILEVFIYPFIYIVVTVLYYDMRVRKEGFDLELLATATQRA
jgi:nitrate reductase NapE component